MLLITITTAAFASTCDTWDADFTATRTPGKGSQSLSYSWSEATFCDGFEPKHYSVCWNDGPSGSDPEVPGAPTDAKHCSTYTTVGGMATGREMVYRSDRAFALRIFACADVDCESWYGDGTAVDENTFGDQADVTTARERWMLRDLEGYDDTDRMIPDADATSASVLVYGGGTPAAGRLGVWYATKVDGVDTIIQRTASAPGWYAWNTHTAWDAPVPVVSAPIDTLGSFGSLSAPWAVPATDGSKYVRLFFRADDDGSEETGSTSQIWSLDSADALGHDFGLVCTEPACDVDGATCLFGGMCDLEDASGDGGAAINEIANSGNAAAAWLTGAGNGRLMYPFYADADRAIDFESEYPQILFTGQSVCEEGADGLFLGSWDGAAWSVDSTDECPVAAVGDVSAPAVVALPNGMYKVYVRSSVGSFDVCLYDGENWAECTPVEMSWDNGTSTGLPDPTLPACTDSLETFTGRAGASPVTAGIVRASTRTDCFMPDEGGLIYVEHRN